MQGIPIWLIAIYLVLWVSGAVVGQEYRRRVRRDHPELAERLFPGLMQKSMGSDLAGLGFILSGELRKVDDPSLVRLGEAFRGLLIAFLVVFVITFAMFVRR